MNKTGSSAADHRSIATVSGVSGRKRVRRLPAALACAAIAVAVAACGSAGTGSGGGQAPAAGSSNGSAPSGGNLSSVTIGKAVDTIGFTTVDVAQANGYFAKEGVKTSSELLSGSSTAFAALQSGSVNFV